MMLQGVAIKFVSTERVHPNPESVKRRLANEMARLRENMQECWVTK